MSFVLMLGKERSPCLCNLQTVQSELISVCWRNHAVNVKKYDSILIVDSGEQKKILGNGHTVSHLPFCLHSPKDCKEDGGTTLTSLLLFPSSLPSLATLLTPIYWGIYKKKMIEWNWNFMLEWICYPSFIWSSFKAL